MTLTSKTCMICKTDFNPKPYQKVQACCSIECDRKRLGHIYSNRAVSNYMRNPKLCASCATVIPIQKKNNKFCSKNCSASYNNKLRQLSDSTKSKISTTMKAKILNGEIDKPQPPSQRKYIWPHTKLYGHHQCNNCNKLFWRIRPGLKCCSISCRDMICSQNKCKKTKIEFFNPFENKTIVLQSSWELSIAQWLTQNDIPWIRPTKRLRWYDTTLVKNRTYLPDFWIIHCNVFLDVKNEYKQEVDKDKIAQLSKLFPLVVGNIDQIKTYVECQTGVEPAFSSIT